MLKARARHATRGESHRCLRALVILSTSQDMLIVAFKPNKMSTLRRERMIKITLLQFFGDPQRLRRPICNTESTITSTAELRTMRYLSHLSRHQTPLNPGVEKIVQLKKRARSRKRFTVPPPPSNELQAAPCRTARKLPCRQPKIPLLRSKT